MALDGKKCAACEEQYFGYIYLCPVHRNAYKTKDRLEKVEDLLRRVTLRFGKEARTEEEAQTEMRLLGELMDAVREAGS